MVDATIAYYRQWLAFDGVWLPIVKERGLITPALDAILREYGIARCVPSRKGDESSERDCKLIIALSKVSGNWPESITARASRCVEIAESKNGLFSARKGKEIFAGSLVSKLMWFLKPEGWTIFDSYAALGVKAKGATKKDQMIDFYKKLVDNKFAELAKEMQTHIDETGFSGIHAARIIDLRLMLEGDFQTPEDLKMVNGTFLKALPKTLSEEIVQLGMQLEDKFGVEKIFHLATK